MNEIHVLFFASLRERTGVNEIMLPWTGGSVAELKAALVKRYPELESSLPSTLLSVDRNYAFDEDPVPPGAEVALFPPVSGG